MRALYFEQTGSLDGLRVAERPKPSAGPGEALVRVTAAAVNPSDAKNVLGKMHETTVPRIPGRDFAGVVEAGPPEWTGRRVFGTGGNLGFGRDGTHAEFVVVPVEGLVAAPNGWEDGPLAAVGLPYVTAALAIGAGGVALREGETLLITGTSGAVGGAAARLADRAGARVIGVVRRTADLGRVGSLPVDRWIDLETSGLAEGCREATEGAGAHVVFDTVGGALFEACLQSLAPGGRQVAISSGGAPRVSFNLVDFYHNQSSLRGVDSLKAGLAAAADILRALVPAFAAGELPPPEVDARPLGRGPDTYREIEAGTLKAKVVLVPAG